MRAVPQFGERRADKAYRDRPAAFGVLVRDGQVAVVRIVKPDAPAYFDLPGGGIDEGETPEVAVVREFAEETGLKVAVRAALTLADQFFIGSEGVPWNNRGSFHVLDLIAEDPALKVEDDHTLVWLDPHEALKILRHDSQAWALAAWLRS
ncbi:NUDIX domain-containing protein [Phenylobacterium sp.]|jgi:8-oxo-dGTP diphosphatase|uniref:NUDIX domain-containing protein n=1 Tax=Phenylobacterium sp. TaxID=1871053 RepID=UPI0035B0101A